MKHSTASAGQALQTQEHALRAHTLTAGYAARIVLHDVDATVLPGSITAVIGPNGSGKSTLLRCFAGALRPRSGHITVDGADRERMTAGDSAARIAYVPQETPTPFAFTADELIRLGRGPRRPADEQAQVVDALDLKPLLHRALTTLSGGERQRAALARALCQQTSYLLFDEPTAHLDPRHQLALFGLLRRRVDAGVGVGVVLHDLAHAARWADRVVGLDQGRVQFDGPTADVLTADRLSRLYQTRIMVAVVDGQSTVIALSAGSPETPAI